MAVEGFMSEEEAERAIWSFYWQIDRHRDRRGAPLVMEPPDTLTPEELERLKSSQTPLWKRVQLKAWEIAKRKAGNSKLASGVVSTIRSWGEQLAQGYLSESQREYLRQLTQEAEAEVQEEAQRSNPGAIDHRTGLPINEWDLTYGRGVVAGRELCLGMIVPPVDLAEATTVWLPPCDQGEDPETWGSDLSHWQALAMKPKDLFCTHCHGLGTITEKVKKSTTRRMIVFTTDEFEHRQVRCSNCGGRGTRPYWTEDEVAAVKHNARLIAEKVHELAQEGYFDLRPINDNDREMGDLVWSDSSGMTLGFRLTPDGYDRMHEYCDQDDEVAHVQHLLTLAGREVRRAAPDWAVREFREGQPAETVDLGGGQIKTAGDDFMVSTGDL